MEGFAFAVYRSTSYTEIGGKGEWVDSDVAKCADCVERRSKEWSLYLVAFILSMKYDSE